MPTLAAKPLKQCKRCGGRKPLDAFHRHRKAVDGKQSDCKECCAEKSRARYGEKRDEIQLKQRAYVEQNRERKRAKDRADYEANRERELERHRQSRLKAPDKYAARTALRAAVLRGDVVKPEHCEECNQRTPARRLHGHHRDYSKPLEVEWLCTGCHGRAHQRSIFEEAEGV